MLNDRECDKCVYHSSGKCSQWSCNGTKTVKDIKNESIDECLKVIRKGMEELLESPWANKSIMCWKDCVITEAFGVIEDLVLKKDIEVMKK